MISKANRNNSFKATLGYLMGKEEAIVLDSGNLWGNSLDQQAREMVIASMESKRTKKPVYHLSLAVSPEDKGKLKDKNFREIAGEYLDKLGLKNNQYIVVRHNDTDHEHIHIVVNRVRDGKAANLGNDYKKLMNIDRAIEKKYGLVIAPKTLRQEHDLNQEKKTTLSKNKAIDESNQFVRKENKLKDEVIQKQKNDFQAKLEAWRKNTREVRKFAKEIDDMKGQNIKIKPEIWKEMREKTYERDKAAKLVLEDVYAQGLHPKKLSLLEKHAQKALTKGYERKPHFVNYVYKWEEANKTASNMRNEINRGQVKDPKIVKDKIIELNKVVIKRNKVAYMLQSDKEQLAQLENAYREAIRNHALQYEKELQMQKQQEIQRGMELEQNRFPEPPRFN